MSITDDTRANIKAIRKGIEVANLLGSDLDWRIYKLVQAYETLLAEHEASKGMQLVSSGVILCGEYHKDCNALISEIKRLKHEATKGMQEKVNLLSERLRIEAEQFQAIRMYTKDGVLAGICADHEMDIYKLLDEVTPLPSGDEG